METIVLAGIVALISVIATLLVVRHRTRTLSINVIEKDEESAKKKLEERLNGKIDVDVFKVKKYPTYYTFELIYLK